MPYTGALYGPLLFVDRGMEMGQRGICIVEGCNQRRASHGGGKFKPRCRKHTKEMFNPAFTYRSFKKGFCEECGFVAKHPCQLDVDHIDGNHENNEEGNLQTLCANCHRLKTALNEEWLN